MGRLVGKTAIVTGASSGIGRSTAYKLAQEGANVVVTARREERLKEVVAECSRLGGKAVYFVGDAALEETAIACVNMAIENFGKVDIMINNVGIGKLKSIIDSTMEDYDQIMNANCRSMFAFSKYAVMDMIKRDDGIIVMVSSITGYIGHADECIYTASKFACRGFAQALDKEFKGTGIKSCVICPNAIKTEFEVGEGRTAEEVAKTNWQTPEDVADAILFAVTRARRSKITEIRLTH
ncbi:MAG: SDR family oxidoreductase [Selenomonadaceae bacterium]|nr:SDR family oxidoreductase [Selenomonadaceae bacterium]